MDSKELYKLYEQHPVITTDSRNCPEGSIFIALKGASFDGNKFAKAALEKGCSYAIIDEKEYAEAGNYTQTLDSIMALRKDYPEAVESRKAALKIWQDASLKMAQADIAKTDSSLQVTLHALEGKRPLFERNMLHVKCDSLKARYEAMCGVVKMIRYRQQHP